MGSVQSSPTRCQMAVNTPLSLLSTPSLQARRTTRSWRRGPLVSVWWKSSIGVPLREEVLPGDRPTLVTDHKPLREMVAIWMHRQSCTKKELESLTGKLQHAKPGRSFLQRHFVQELFTAGLADSTQEQARSGSYTKFCAAVSLSPFPAAKLSLSAFVTFPYRVGLAARSSHIIGSEACPNCPWPRGPRNRVYATTAVSPEGSQSC